MTLADNRMRGITRTGIKAKLPFNIRYDCHSISRHAVVSNESLITFLGRAGGGLVELMNQHSRFRRFVRLLTDDIANRDAYLYCYRCYHLPHPSPHPSPNTSPHPCFPLIFTNIITTTTSTAYTNTNTTTTTTNTIHR